MIVTPSRFIFILCITSISHTHDFYYAQRLVEQVTLDNFHDTWNEQLTRTLTNLWQSPLHKKRIKMLIDDKLKEFEQKQLDVDPWIALYGAFTAGIHLINGACARQEYISLYVSHHDDLLSPMSCIALDSYRKRKNLINYTLRFISIPFWLYCLKSLRANQKIETATLSIIAFKNHLLSPH